MHLTNIAYAFELFPGVELPILSRLAAETHCKSYANIP